MVVSLSISTAFKQLNQTIIMNRFFFTLFLTAILLGVIANANAQTKTVNIQLAGNAKTANTKAPRKDAKVLCVWDGSNVRSGFASISKGDTLFTQNNKVFRIQKSKSKGSEYRAYLKAEDGDAILKSIK